MKNLKKLVSDLQPYNYITHRPDYYTFITSAGCEYHCYFFDFSTSFSDYPELAPLVFGFNLELKSVPEGLAIVPPDKRIAYTVTTILKTFLSEKKNVVVYICDNSDNREKARFHKFTNWFRAYNDGSIIEIKGVIRANHTDILNALLIHKDNTLLNDFIEAYTLLTGFYSKPDDEELNNILNDDGW